MSISSAGLAKRFSTKSAVTNICCQFMASLHWCRIETLTNGVYVSYRIPEHFAEYHCSNVED